MHVQSRQILSLPFIRPPPTHTHTHTGAQPVTLRVCPNCEESCHIRCKKCPECEDEFPPSTKSRAKPDQDIVENSSNLLQILQKKVTIYTVHTVYCLFALSSTPEVMWSIMASFMLHVVDKYAWDYFYMENANF